MTEDLVDAAVARRPGDPLAGSEADCNTILFVDDDPALLADLRAAMQGYRRKWRVAYAPGAEEALRALETEPAAVLISALEMRGMDGAALLAAARDSHPTTVRIILSGFSDPQLVTMAATVAHRFVGLPCGAGELGLLIERSCALRELTEGTHGYRATVAATSLPSRPGLYARLTEILADPAWRPDQVAAVIENDPAITAKVLQLANSAFFGVRHRVTRVREAVVYLGVETITSLTLAAEAFGKLATKRTAGFSIEDFQRHAMLVARIAAAILPEGRVRAAAATAGLLHDIGKLILVADDPRHFDLLYDLAQRRGLPLHDIEREEDGVSHADTGACLLSLWGLPDDVVEAVAHHHDPQASLGLGFDAVAAVHVADALAHELEPPARLSPPPGALDEPFLDRLGMGDRLGGWCRTGRVRCRLGGAVSGRERAGSAWGAA